MASAPVLLRPLRAPPLARQARNWFAETLSAEPEADVEIDSGPTYTPYGAAADYFRSRDPEVVLSGPAGTGKSLAILARGDSLARQYPGFRGLLLRKTGVGLAASGLVTFRRHVRRSDTDPAFFSGNKERPAQYEYHGNGSVLVVGGLDNAQKILSTDYDWIGVIQAEDLTLAEWETLTTRLRSGTVPFQQISGDCNPDAPTHWLKQRAEAGLLRMLESRHEDNPMLWDREAREWTPQGAAYIATLDRLTGVRRDRLRFGKWVAAEGAVYEAWDARRHILDEETLRLCGLIGDRVADGFELGPAVRTVWGSVDWGFTNPGVMQIWLEDGDGRLYRLHEVYQTGRQVDPWWLERAEEFQARYDVRQWICDPAEPAFISAFRGKGLNATGGNNSITPGIQAVQARLADAPDGAPRLFVLRADPGGFDQTLVERHKPCSTEQEIPAYIWDTAGGVRAKGEVPVKIDDHGVDATRYLVAEVDGVGGRPSYDSF